VKWIWIGAVAALIAGVVFALVLRRADKEPKVDLSEPQPASTGPSLYDLIGSQVRASPEKPLDIDQFPPTHEMDASGVSFAPGLRDQFFGGGDGDEDGWQTVLGVIHGINDGRIKTWLVAEQNLRDVSAAAHVDRVLERLRVDDITPVVKDTFWEVARRSESYEAVKWGIAIGGIQLTDAEVEDLLLLARHPEFTLYASHVLMRESERQPGLKQKLLDLLPLSRQWGVVNVIDYIVSDKEWVRSPDVQRLIVIYGMENHDGISMEVGFTIASAIDFQAVFAAAATDERLFQAVVDLVCTLIDEPQPLGGLTDLPNWQEVYAGFRKLLDGHDVDITVLAGLLSLERFLEDETLSWDRRQAEASGVRALLKAGVSAEAVKAGLQSERYRWIALSLVEKYDLRQLLPDVHAVFDARPDFTTIEVLGKMGGTDGLEHLLRAIPRLVDLDARKKIPLRDVNSFGPEHKYNFEYAKIVEYLGDLGTEPAVLAITTAAQDYDPGVRAAACTAITRLPRERVTDELRGIVRERLSDPSEYVAKAAGECAKAIGL